MEMFTFTTTKRIQHMNTKEFMPREKRIKYMYTETKMYTTQLNSTQNTRDIDKKLKDSYKEIILKSMSIKEGLYFIT